MSLRGDGLKVILFVCVYPQPVEAQWHLEDFSGHIRLDLSQVRRGHEGLLVRVDVAIIVNLVKSTVIVKYWSNFVL